MIEKYSHPKLRPQLCPSLSPVLQFAPSLRLGLFLAISKFLTHWRTDGRHGDRETDALHPPDPFAARRSAQIGRSGRNLHLPFGTKAQPPQTLRLRGERGGGARRGGAGGRSGLTPGRRRGALAAAAPPGRRRSPSRPPGVHEGARPPRWGAWEAAGMGALLLRGGVGRLQGEGGASRTPGLSTRPRALARRPPPVPADAWASQGGWEGSPGREPKPATTAARPSRDPTPAAAAAVIGT